MFTFFNKFFGTFCLAIVITISATAQNPNSTTVATTAPGYFGRTQVISYESGVFTNYFLGIGIGLMQSVSYEKVVSRRTSFGAKLFVTNNYPARLDLAFALEGNELHEASIQQQIDNGTIPQTNGNTTYNVFMDDVRTRGFGLSTYARWYSTKSFAPEGWFFDLHLGLIHTTTNGLYAEFTRPELKIPIDLESQSRTVAIVGPGFGYSKGISKRLLFTVNCTFNFYAIFNAVSHFPQIDLIPTEDAEVGEGSFDDQLRNSISNQTSAMGLSQLNFGLRYTL